MSEIVRCDTLSLVSEKWPLRKSEPRLVAAVGVGNVLLETHTAALLKCLLRDCGGMGRIVPVSGWRSLEEQRSIWELAIERGGESYARSFVAAPGCSEHHTGLAVDLALSSGSKDIITPDFSGEGICEAFRKMAPAYGFVLRYPVGKEQITGIAYENWHYRYVGIPHALLISTMHLCLEEYLELLTAGEKFEFKRGAYHFIVSYSSSPDRTPESFDAALPAVVSEDNRGGYVFTGIRGL